MGLLTQEIKEIRQMIKLYDLGKVDSTQVTDKMKMYKEARGRIKIIYDAVIFSTTNASGIKNRLHSLNILSKGEAVLDKDDLEIEMVKCPDKDEQLITRAECLDYSGETEHMETCQTCENFKITRRLLLPEN